MKHFVYIRGNPGTGKITVAKILEKELGWKVFWFHDLKNAIFHIVGEHRIPRLMDEVTAPVIKYVLEKSENVIYVRPSPDLQTVQNIQKVVGGFPGYQFHVVRLEASYEELHKRVTSRIDPYRITSKKDLDAYLQERTVADFPNEILIDTDGLTPKEVAQQVKNVLGES